MSKVLSIDIGYGYVKAATNNEKLKFPTVCMPESRDKMISENPHKYEMEIDKAKWRVGDYALAKGQKRTWATVRQVNSDTSIYVATAAHMLCEDGDKIDLLLGLPYGFYRDLKKGEALIEELTGKTFTTIFAGDTKILNIASVHVYPQGTGCYFSKIAKLDNDGKIEMIAKTDDDLNAIMVDCGFRTLDVITMYAEDNNLCLQEESSFSNENLGISSAIEEIADKVSSLAETHVYEDEIESAINAGKSTIYINGDDIDFSKLESDAYADLAEKIYKYIEQRIGQTIIRYKHIYLCGGGAFKILPYIQKFIPRIVNQDDIFGNCIGYMVMYENETKQAKKAEKKAAKNE